MCNAWCLEIAQKTVPLLQGGSILEVGSRIVNGGVRPILEPLASVRYLGVDIEEGDGVDLILDATKLSSELAPASFDLVISTEMLEHCELWREALQEMLRVLKPQGILALTTRSPGFELHGYPFDYWRFTRNDIEAIFSPIGEILVLEDDMTLGWPCGVGVIVRVPDTSESVVSAWGKSLAEKEVESVGEINFADLTRLLEKKEREILRMHYLLQEQSAWAQECVQTIEQRDKQISELQSSLEEVSRWAQQLNATLEEQQSLSAVRSKG